MNIVIVTLCAAGVIYSALLGTGEQLSSAAAGSAVSALELWFTVAAGMMFWSGLMRVAEKAGLVDKVCRLVRPLLRLLLPEAAQNSKLMRAASMNLASNLLGLGNAAMPFGIRAMKELERSRCSRRDIAVFILLNTASVQLIPMNVITLRASAGSASPADCVLPVLANSAAALCCGLLMAAVVYGGKRNADIRYGSAAADTCSADSCGI